MPFTGTGTGIQNANDVFFSGLSQDNVLRYNGTTAKWNNVPLSITASDIADSTITEQKLSITNSPTSGHVLSWDGSGLAWVAQSSGSVTIADLPAGTTLTVSKSAGVWPARPTSRSDIVVQWKGPDPSPSIVSSGTGGMLDNVDIRLVTP
ncbi:hypothetical protein JNM87_02270 [Candidatus Saccharibacteria bacterium]|nr:hypothetical protein [Candidatus Saccharibacteria bacterium]